MMKVLFILLCVVGLISFGCVFLVKKSNKVIFKDEDKAVIIGCIVGFVCVIGVLIIGFTTGIFKQEPKSNGNWSEKASKECRNRTNTYYKCRWSVVEDRCVCKQR